MKTLIGTPEEEPAEEGEPCLYWPVIPVNPYMTFDFLCRPVMITTTTNTTTSWTS